jgi:hypothetical protein
LKLWSCLTDDRSSALVVESEAEKEGHPRITFDVRPG